MKIQYNSKAKMFGPCELSNYSLLYLYDFNLSPFTPGHLSPQRLLIAPTMNKRTISWHWKHKLWQAVLIEEVVQPLLAACFNPNSVKRFTTFKSHLSRPYWLSNCWLFSPYKFFSSSLEQHCGKVVLLDLFPLSIVVILKLFLGQMPLDHTTFPIAAHLLTGTRGL